MLPKFLAWTAFALAMLFAMLSSVGILAGGLLGTSTATAMVFSGAASLGIAIVLAIIVVVLAVFD